MQASMLLLAFAVPALAQSPVSSGSIRIEFNKALHSRVYAKDTPIGPFSASETIQVGGEEVTEFVYQSEKREAIADKLGKGTRTVVSGTAPSLRKTVAATAYDDFPDMIVFEVQYANTGRQDLRIDGWTNNRYFISAGEKIRGAAFWSYQSGSYESRPDWVLPVSAGFKQENYLGMNATDYGGGTPVSDIWRRDGGLAVGHLELVPKLVSLPVMMPDPSKASLAVVYKTSETVLKPGEVLTTLRTFVAVHEGDYFRPLTAYRRAMVKQGVKFKPSPESAFEPIWCAWGFGRTFTPKQVYDALPIVKKLGFRWATLDDGWQTSLGDWLPVKSKFPAGDADMRAMVDKFHSDGFRAQLWWAPLAVSPESDLAKQHPEMLLLNADGSKQKISYWNSYYLCPADPAVIEYHRKLVMKMINDWDYDGLKLDGQFMNGVPPCYNPAHKHARPEDAVERLPDFFKAIYETAQLLKPNAVVEFCPCGTAYSFFLLPQMNMSVASDPTSSWQVRTKGKTLKALQGDAIAYFGDHVELSDNGEDFASTVGIGGVIGTNFRWPPRTEGSARRRRGDLTPEKEKTFAKWVDLYKAKMLSRGEYLGGLYDIGFDRPEAHAIRKDSRMYYAFYAPEFDGQVELRGLEARSYRVTDYENGRELGTVRGPGGSLPVRFSSHLLLEAVPESN